MFSYNVLENQAKVKGIIQILTEKDETPADCAIAVVNKDLSVYLKLQGAINAEAEREKLRKKRDGIQK
jgi:valyl-tRNA synthetase